MRYAVKNRRETVEAYCLGGGSEMERRLDPGAPERFFNAFLWGAELSAPGTQRWFSMRSSGTVSVPSQMSPLILW